MKTEQGTLKSMVYENTTVSNDNISLVGNRTMTDGKVSRFSGVINDASGTYSGDFAYVMPMGVNGMHDPAGNQQELSARVNNSNVRSSEAIELLLSAVEEFNQGSNE